MSVAVILRCERSEPRRVVSIANSTSFEARRKCDAHLQDERTGVHSGMTPTLLGN
jgi:hypothetical protein